MMKIRPQMTIVEERIRMPAWRSVSPKKRRTRSEKTSATIREQNLTISPNEAIQSLGTASQPISGPSLDHRDLGVGGEQRLREHVVEREHPERRDHHRLVDGSTDTLRAARRRHPLVTADERDDRPEHRALEHRHPEVRARGVGEERRPERAERGSVDER